MSAPSVPAGTAAGPLTIRPWPDDVIDSLGHDPRSHYVETYWLGILGPSTTWLLRRLVAGLDVNPEGFELDLADTARCLGLGDKGVVTHRSCGPSAASCSSTWPSPRDWCSRCDARCRR